MPKICAGRFSEAWTRRSGRAGARFDEQLDDAIRATRNVIGDALGRRRDTSFAVEPEVIRLDRSIERLSAVRKSLAG